MHTNIEKSREPPSVIKYQAPLDITQKLQAYRQANYLPTQSDIKPSAQDILNIILPPREWKNNQQYFLQYVSHHQPGREDVERTKNKLEQSLLHYQARTDGLCPIKQKIISQTFDEIIRQVTLNSTERGLMLMRVRDERKMTIAAHQTVYESGVAYGIKRQAQAEKGMADLQGQLKALQFKQQKLEKRKQELLSKKESMQQKYRERRVVEHQKMEYELSSLVSQNKFLSDFLDKNRKDIVEVVVEPQDQEQN